MTKATFYHAGCPVCVSAEESLVDALDSTRYSIEKVHLGEQPQRVADAKLLGVKSVPALVVEGTVYHVNFGADIEDLG
jgi:glutaredoxin